MKRKGTVWLIILIPLLGGIIVAIIMMTNSCKKEFIIPSVGTVQISNVTETSIRVQTEIISGGGDEVSQKGVCWSITPDPTISGNKTLDGPGTGVFYTNVTGLSPSTDYYIRAYATNTEGTGYGESVTVHTWSGTIEDIDNNLYYTTIIGTQEWMGANLRTTRLNDGNDLELISDDTAITTTNPGYRFCNPVDADIYGAIYNGYAVMSDKLCPKGWRVPSYDDWYTMITYLGGYRVAGGKMKETGTAHWNSPNTDATNESGFTAVSAGSFGRYSGGCDGDGVGCSMSGYAGYWWSSSQNKKDFREDTVLYVAVILYDSAGVYPGSGFLYDGRSVRCIKDQ